MSKFTSWKTQPIFISSTFTDMMAERDALRDYVFPELEEKLLQRKTRLEAIDLRWGVETSDKKKQEEKELLVLKVCLDEIDRSLPFFIGIIGDRYGWVPPKERIESVEREKGFKSEIKDKSVTALEIEYGVLANKEQLERSFFFFREPLPYDSIPEDSKAKYADMYVDNTDKYFARQRVEDFKNLIIKKVGASKVINYKAGWDKENNKVVGLDDFKQKVLEKLWKELDEQTKSEVAIRPNTWQDEERVYLDEFVENRTISFSGREKTITELCTFSQSKNGSDTWGLCLHGESGGGKSAIFAKLYKQLKNEDDILVLGHAAGISLRSNNIDNMLMMWIEELAKELHQDINQQLEGSSKFEHLKKLFSELLSQAAVKKRVVILVDALNQFEDTSHSEYVNWLPELIPSNSKFIFTAISGKETENLKKRNGLELKELDPISSTDAEDIISIICNNYHKELNRKVINKLLDKKKKDGTYAYCNALWLTMAVDEFLLLDEDDFNRMKSLKGNAEEKLLQLLLVTAEELPSDIPGMYNYVFNRAGIFGEEFVNNILSYISISRNGLRESDLKELINNYTNTKWEPLNFAAFRRYMRSHLVRKGEIGLWDFRHMQARESLKNTLLFGNNKIKTLHSNLAGHLGKLPIDDPLAQSEIIWHLFKSDNKDKAAQLYGNSSDDEITDIFSNTIKDVLVENENNASWIASIIGLPQSTEDVRRGMINNILFNLDKIVKDYININPRLAILKETIKTAKQLSDKNPNSEEYARDLSIAYNNIGDVYIAKGKNKKALESFKDALNIREKLCEKFPNIEMYASDSSISFDRIGDRYFFLDEIQDARKNYESSLKIREKLVKENPESTDYLRNLSISYARMGDIDKDLKIPKSAKKYFEEYLKITKKLHNQYPESAIYSNDVSLAYNKLGDIYMVFNEPENAFDNYNKALEIREELFVRYPQSSQYARDLLSSHGRMGDACNAKGDTTETLEYYKKALKINVELYKRYPSSATIKRDLFSSHIRIGEFYNDIEKPQKALHSYEDSFTISEELCKLTPESADYNECKAISLSEIGSINKTLGNIDTAVNYYERALKIRLELRNSNNTIINYKNVIKLRKEQCEQNPSSIEYVKRLFEQYRDLGNFYKANGDAEKAITNYTHSVETQKGLCNKFSGTDDELYILVLSYTNLGNNHKVNNDDYNAILNYDKALETLENILERNPRSYEIRLNLASSCKAVADLKNTMGLKEEAYNLFEKATTLFQENYNDDKKNEKSINELSIMFSKIDSLCKDAGKLELVQKYYVLKKNLAEILYFDNPEKYKGDFANTLLIIGEVNIKMNQTQDAISSFEKSADLFQELHESSPEIDDIIKRLSYLYTSIENYFQKKGDSEKVLHYCVLRCNLARELYEKNPRDEKLAINLARLYLTIGDLNIEMDKTDDAIHFFKLIIDIFEDIHKENPKMEIVNEGLSICYSKLAGIFMNKGQLEKVLFYRNKGNELSQELFSGNPQNVKFVIGIANSFYEMGLIYQELEQIDDSKVHFNYSLRFFEKLYADTGNEAFKINNDKIIQILDKLNN